MTIAQTVLGARSELRREVQILFGADWPTPAEIVEAFQRYAVKVFDVNASASQRVILAEGVQPSNGLRSMARNLLEDVFGLEWQHVPGDEVVRTNWEHGPDGWKGTEVLTIAGNDPDPNCLYHRFIGEAVQYRLRFHAPLPDPIPGEPPGVNLSNLDWWRYIGLKERHNIAKAIQPYLDDRIAHWQFAYEAMDKGHENSPAVEADPIIGRLAAKISRELEKNDHYAGEIRKAFDLLLHQVLTFCADRLDATSSELGRRGDYRFRRDSRGWDLQADLREWLVGNFRAGDISAEAGGIATGRADIRVTRGGARFVIEVKKEDSDASPTGLQRHLRQATAYQVTNARLGFLGVLDLTRMQATHLEENVWVEELRVAPDGLVRHVVVFRIIGNLLRPSELSAG